MLEAEGSTAARTLKWKEIELRTSCELAPFAELRELRVTEISESRRNMSGNANRHVKNASGLARRLTGRRALLECECHVRCVILLVFLISPSLSFSLFFSDPDFFSVCTLSVTQNAESIPHVFVRACVSREEERRGEE